MRNTRPSLAVVLAAVLLGGAITLTTAAPAAAHDELLSSYPAADSTITGSPAEITLTFSGELLADMQSAVIEVIAPDGQNIATDAPTVDGTAVTQHLTPDPPDGVFTVRWRVVSSDGHPISGEYTYIVEPLTAEISTPAPAATTAEQTPEPSPAPTNTTGTDEYGGVPSGGGAVFPILAVLTGVLLVGGTLMVVLMVARERRRRDRAAAEQAGERNDAAAGKDSTNEP